ncbi:hypothetical protein LguiA_028882 [Lonicera macranthoides]
MPLLDIATAQPTLPSNPYTIKSQIPYHGTFIFGIDKRLASSSWKSFWISEKAKMFNHGRIVMQPGGLIMIRAVATLEPKYSIQRNDGHKGYHNLQLDTDAKSPSLVEHQSESEDAEVDEREKLRRMRISKANKGNTPWNKGRKHSPETLRRIKEKTRLAMQNPKVKMKLANLGHAQSKETRMKIGVGVRIGWERRRKKLMLQETCHFEWQNLIAEASRRGFVEEQELQWNSYMILDEQLQREWLESIELRRRAPKPKGGKRAPKSPEQRRKISAAIAAKWSDPTYRDRVYSGLSKYHGTAVGVEKPRRRPSSDRQTRRSAQKKKSDLTDNSSVSETGYKTQRPKLKRSKMPKYEDPLASSKLEMIKNIRARRAAAENEKNEAITRAKLLIAEAEKAANALEVAAKMSPLAQASLIETRKLIAQAIQSLQSTRNDAGRETEEEIEDRSQTSQTEVNGTRALASSDCDMMDLGFGKFNLQDLLDGEDEIIPTSSDDHDLVNGKEELNQTGSSDNGLSTFELDCTIEHSSIRKQLAQLEPNGCINGVESKRKKEETRPNRSNITKKWVCGKLVEVAEDS